MTDQTMPSLLDPIPNLLLRNTLNLLIGSSKDGKTHLLFSTIADYLTNNRFLNMRPKLAQRPRLGYLDLQNPASDTDALRSLYDLPNPIFPRVSALDAYDDSCDYTIDHLYSTFPEPRPQLLLVDGIFRLLRGSNNDSDSVGRFCASIRKFCIAQRVTLWATTLRAKQKPGEGYTKSCDKVFGSNVWSSAARMISVLEPVDGEKPEERQTSLRRLVLTPPHGPKTIEYYDFDAAGRFVRAVEPDNWEERLTARLLALDEGTELTKAQLVAWGEEFGLRVRSVESWISLRRADCALEDVRKGLYRVPRKV